MSDYIFHLEREVLGEIAAGVLSNLRRILRIYGIDTEEKGNSIVILYWNIVEIKSSLIGDTYKTMDDLKKVEGQLVFLKKYISQLKETINVR